MVESIKDIPESEAISRVAIPARKSLSEITTPTNALEALALLLRIDIEAIDAGRVDMTTEKFQENWRGIIKEVKSPAS